GSGAGGGAGGAAAAGSASILGGSGAVLSHGTRFPCPHSQKIVVPTELSGRPCVLPHCLQANQIMRRPSSGDAPHSFRICRARVLFGRRERRQWQCPRITSADAARAAQEHEAHLVVRLLSIRD